MPSPTPSNSAATVVKPSASKPSSSKPKRRVQRRGRGRDDLSDEEVEREALTDSDASSRTMDSDSESEDELAPASNAPASKAAAPSKPNVSASPPTPSAPKPIVNGGKSTIPASTNWSEMVEAEIVDGPESLPVIDFTELGTLATTVATHDAPSSSTPVVRSDAPQLTKAEKLKLKRKAKKEKLRAAAAAVAAAPSSSTAPQPNTSSSQVTPSASDPSTVATTATQPAEPETETSSSQVQRGPPSRPPKPNPRQAYLERLTKDPSFVPRVGAFWGHDDRLLDKDLRSMSPWWRGRGRGGAFRGGAGRGDGNYEGGVGGRGGFNGAGSGFRGRGRGFGGQDTAGRGRGGIAAASPRADGAASPSPSSAQQQRSSAPSRSGSIPNGVKGTQGEAFTNNYDTSRDSDSWHSRGARGGARGRGSGRGSYRSGSSNLPHSAGTTTPASSANAIPLTGPPGKKGAAGNGKPPPAAPKKDRNSKAKASKYTADPEASIPLDQRPLTPISNTSSGNVRVKLPGTSLPASIQLSTEDVTLAKTSNGKVAASGTDGQKEPEGSRSRSPIVRLPSKGAANSTRPKVRVGGPLAAAASAAAKSSAHVRSPLAVEIPLPSLFASASDDAGAAPKAQPPANASTETGSTEPDPFVVHIPPDEARADLVRQTISTNIQSQQPSTPSNDTQTPSSPAPNPNPDFPNTSEQRPEIVTSLPPSGYYPYSSYPQPPPPFSALPPGVAVGENGVLFEIASGRPVLLTQPPPQPQYHQAPIYQPPPRLAFTPQPFHPSRVHTPDSAASAAGARTSLPTIPASYGFRVASTPVDNVNSEVSLSMDVGPGAPPVPIFVPARSSVSGARSRAVEIRAPSVESSSSFGTSNTPSGKSAGTMTNGTTASTSGSVSGSSLPTSPSNVFVPGSRMWSPTSTGKGKGAPAPSNLRASVVSGAETESGSTAKQDANAPQSVTQEFQNPYYQPQGYGAPGGYYGSPVDYAIYAPVPIGPDGQPQMQYGGYYHDPMQYGGPPAPGAYYGGPMGGDPYGVSPNPYGTVYYGAANPYAAPGSVAGQPGDEANHGYY